MKNILILIYITFLLGATSCKPSEEQLIMTVNGPISASKIGVSLVHEHVLVDFAGADSTGYHRWNKDEVVARVLPYLNEIKQWKVNTFFECTPAFLGRDPWVLQSLSELSGMHIVTNTGYYGAHGNRYIPDHFYELSASELSQIWIREFKQGIEGSGIKPGFIKIAVDEGDSLSPEHTKIIHAAALAHKETGLVIASHTGPDKPAFEQIEVLKSHGIDPSAFVWVHAQQGSLEGNMKAGKAGTWISLDNVNAQRKAGSEYDIAWYANRILALKNASLLHRVLISHDAGWFSPGEEQGGDFRGYSALFEDLIPALREVGFTQDELDLILIENPSKAYRLRPTFI